MKKQVIQIRPHARCSEGSFGLYAVTDEGERIGTGRTAIQAWADAFENLGGVVGGPNTRITVREKLEQEIA